MAGSQESRKLHRSWTRLSMLRCQICNIEKYNLEWRQRKRENFLLKSIWSFLELSISIAHHSLALLDLSTTLQVLYLPETFDTISGYWMCQVTATLWSSLRPCWSSLHKGFLSLDFRHMLVWDADERSVAVPFTGIACPSSRWQNCLNTIV